MKEHRFKHRIAFGCWINDVRDMPSLNKIWPDIKIDRYTIKSMTNLIDLISIAGYNSLDLFGLLVGENWPVNLEETLNRDREDKINYIINYAHSKNLKIIFGLSIFGWGFKEIINYDPETKSNGCSVMCGSKNKSFVWQEKIIDFITAKFNIDGFHLEAFNGGRCKCFLCNKVNNIEYFSRLNTVVAKYIKNTYQDKMVFVNNCGCLPWGDYVVTKDFKHLYELCNHIDVFLDNGCHGLFISEENRADFIRGLNCDFGTSGGIWFCSPSKKNRLTWFLPYADKVYKYLKKISNDGARACYYYMGPIINPSTEFNIYFGGLAMSNINLEFNEILNEVIDKLYRPKNNSARENLMEIFVRAENAYFGNWNPSMDIFSIKKEFLGGLFEFYEWSKENYRRIKSGELFLEPLVNNKIELPLYLLINMNKIGRMKYRKKLDEILKDLAKIGNNFKDNRKIDIIRICMENVIKDLDRYIDFQVYS